MFCKLILPTNDIYKLGSLPTTYEELCRIIQNKLNATASKDFSLRYKDSDDDFIIISTEDDFKLAVTSTTNENQKTLRIFVALTDKKRSQDLKRETALNSLPGVPEISEKSKSPQSEASNTENNSALTSKQSLNLSSGSPSSKFTKAKPGLNEDAAASTTPLSEKPVNRFAAKKFFTFSRTGSVELPLVPEETDLATMLCEKQIKAIENLVDAQIEQEMQQNMQFILNKLTAKLQEEAPLSNGPHSSLNQSDVLPTNFVRSNVRRNTMQNIVNPSVKSFLCAECSVEIKGIKYSCLTCLNYLCCESCENQCEHPHPLLKIKPFHQQKENVGQNSAPKTCIPPKTCSNIPSPFAPKKSIFHFGAGTPLKSFQSETNLPSCEKRDDNSINSANGEARQLAMSSLSIRRGVTVGTIFNSGKNQKVSSECETKYKAMITKPSAYDIINTNPGNSYSVHLSIKNIGENKWLDQVKLVCINGIYKEKEIDIVDLHPGEEKLTIVTLEAPMQNGRHLSQWKLHYFEEGIGKPFGKAIFVDIEVDGQVDGQGIKSAAKGEEDISLGTRCSGKTFQLNLQTFQDSKDSDKKLMQEMKCCELVLNQARMLNDMFPGDIREKIDFIRHSTLSYDINDIVTCYLAKIGSMNRRKLPWEKDQGISTWS